MNCLTIKEAAVKMRIGTTLLRQMVHTGELPSIRLGAPGSRNAKYLIDVEDIDAYLHAKKAESVAKKFPGIFREIRRPA